MKVYALASAALAVSAVSAHAVGLDRSARPTGLIFESGNVLEFSVGGANPSIDGTDVLTAQTGNIGDSFVIWGAGLRYEINDQLSFGVIIDEPYGADVFYGATTPVLSGTQAIVDSNAVTAFGRYKFDDNWSVHGGIVYQSVSANVTLSGLGYGPLSGYNAAFANDSSVGFMVGAAYEIPEIALRVALTYHSEIDHDLDTVETVSGAPVAASSTEVTTPETIELAFQSGVAENTLVFGSVRFSHYSVTQVSPSGLQFLTSNPEASLTDLENAWDAEIGVGRRFNEQWAGTLSVGWEQKGEDDFVSPLGGTNGALFLAIGASYDATESVNISGGVRFTQFYDANPQVGGSQVATFEGNSAVSAGLRVRYKF